MVHRIVKNHNGRITCHSTPGEGTHFRIYIPAVESGPKRQAAGATQSNQGGNETILLVDDDVTVQYSGKSILAKAGYTMLTASDAEEALTIHAQPAGKIDLVLLDLIMPGMGGIKCLKKLNEIDPRLKILVISGDSPDEAAMQTIDACASGYLAKPYTSGQLLTTIRSILDGDGAAGRH